MMSERSTLPGKEGKRLAKIIKEEAKSEKKALSVAITELAELQKLQKQAIKVSLPHKCLVFYLTLYPLCS